MIVAIDGPAGVGKSSIARACAAQLGYLCINSGTFYRAVTLAVLEGNLDPRCERDVIEAALEVERQILTIDRARESMAAEDKLHTEQVDRWVSQHSAIVSVRSIVNRCVRRLVAERDAIVEGRDVATVIFPEAELKIYLDAELEERSRRRVRQRHAGIGVAQSDSLLQAMKVDIDKRDRYDRGKGWGKLERADDALYIDTTHLTQKQVCDRIVKTIAGL